MADIPVTSLASYLGEVVRRRFAFGDLDCCTFMADWLMRCGLDDPMVDRRGTYATYREYRSAMRSEGGLVASCRKRFAAVGLSETKVPKPGDVCLINVPTRIGRCTVSVLTGAICVTDQLRAVVTSDMGLVIASVRGSYFWEMKRA